MPTQCCLLGVCCPPEQRVKALSDFLGEAAPDVDAFYRTAMAQHLLDAYDIGPKGLGEFIVAGYEKAFAGE